MTDKQNPPGSRLAKGWTRIVDFLEAMDPDPYVYSNEKISRLQNEIASLESRLERLESSCSKHS